MNKFKKLIVRLCTDIAGYGLIILGCLTGWLPGPGGIPLILAGLGLLSINNHWARKIIIIIKNHGSRLMDYLFPENPWVKASHDALVVVLITAATYLFITRETLVNLAVGISLSALAIVDFMYNRKRWHSLQKKFKKR